MKTKKQIFEEHPEYFSLKCGICGKYFIPKSYEQYKNLKVKSKKFNRIFYCSNECRNKRFDSKIYHCDYCGKEINVNKYSQKHRKNHFCSRECFTAYKKVNKATCCNEIRTCLNCGKSFNIGKNYKGKFCSKTCNIEYKNKKTDEKIEKRIKVSSRVLKAYLLRHYSKCMNPNCKWDWSNETDLILELHHIDGNYKNNTLDNCLLLCPNCHSLTDNYKFKNAHKSTRKYRKKYYKKKE